MTAAIHPNGTLLQLFHHGRFGEALQLLRTERPATAESAADACLVAALAAQHLEQWSVARDLARVWAQQGAHVAGGPLVTIVIPTHDRPVTLRRALRSVAAQLYRPLEAVVVNDAGGPVDDVVREFAAELPVRVVTHAENRYLAAARNTGVEHARGQFVGFLDDDDQLYPHHVGHLVQLLQCEGARAAAANAYALLPAGPGPRFDIFRSRPLTRGEFYLENIIPVQCALLETALAREVGSFDTTLRANEDWEYWVRIAERSRWAQSSLLTSCVDKSDESATMTGKGVAAFLLAHADIYRRFDAGVRAYGGATLAAQTQHAMYCLAERTVPELCAEPAALVVVGDGDAAGFAQRAIENAFAPFDTPVAFAERLQVFQVRDADAGAVALCARRAAGAWLAVAARAADLPAGWFARGASALAADRRIDAVALDGTGAVPWYGAGYPRAAWMALGPPAQALVRRTAFVTRNGVARYAAWA